MPRGPLLAINAVEFDAEEGTDMEAVGGAA